MSKTIAQEIQHNMVDNLTKTAFLKEAALTKNSVLSLLHQEKWQNKLADIPGNRRFSCKEILELAQESINQLSPTPPDGWLDYAYHYLVNLLFPVDSEEFQERTYTKGLLFFLGTLRTFFQYERKHLDFDPLFDFDFLSQEAISGSDLAGEYDKFTTLYQKDYLYELMRISKEVTSYNILGHIAGVHHIAMHIARQLKEANVPIDLSLISGAAIGHDIGKYGCKPSEAKRIPYLHYYYTQQWFERNDMPNIGHIAANHSTWDLELENLPVESLVLIYADFRVKKKKSMGQEELVHFYSLAESYHVILSKLDNVDAAKEQRYAYVYTKLQDFERYMQSLGVNTNLSYPNLKPIKTKNVALLDTAAVIDTLKYLAIEHNIYLMHRLGNNASFGNILEAARSEKNWKNLRSYLNIFSEYCTYLSKKQKRMTLDFLYPLLMHKEGDIRRQVAGLIGDIILNYDEEYRKELPADGKIVKEAIDSTWLWKKYLEDIIYPDHKIAAKYRSWMGYVLKFLVDAVLSQCKPTESEKYLKEFLRYYQKSPEDDFTAFVLLDSMLYLPLSLCSEEDLLTMTRFALALLEREDLKIQVSSLRFLNALSKNICRTSPCRPFLLKALELATEEKHINIAFLKHEIASQLGIPLRKYEAIVYDNPEATPEIFLENLKIATPWIVKEVNIEILLQQLKRNPNNALHVATHLANLIKVSERVVLRHRSGDAILSIAPLLSRDQRNEIAIELLRGLEIGQYEFSKYIPPYLGEFALYLHPKELDELIENLQHLLNEGNNKAASVTLNTLGILIQQYHQYKTRFPEEEDGEKYQSRRQRILGMILAGFANYHQPISQEAFFVLGKYIFGSKTFSYQEKHEIFQLIHKKLLTLLYERHEEELDFFNNAASLNHIYRFMVDYAFYYKDFHIEEKKKIAFFPGTFDPFTLSHKGIIREIRNQGFEVYLALDEFSWSKKTQPRMIRRQILNMSVASEFSVYLFPDDIPVNIANPYDLKELKRLFPGKDIYMVVGSDVIVNASSYKSTPSQDSIHHFNHIIFQRHSSNRTEGNVSEVIATRVFGKIVELALPVHLEDISSTRIRENVDENRDIASFVDPVVQNFIYDNRLYLREPQYKPVLHAKAIASEVLKEVTPDVIEVISHAKGYKNVAVNEFQEYHKKNNLILVLLRDYEKNGSPIGLAVLQPINTSELYEEFQSTAIADHIRRNTSGKILLVTDIYTHSGSSIPGIDHLVLTEALAHAVKRDFTYALYHARFQAPDIKLLSTLKRQGFFPILGSKQEHPIYAVDMKCPIAMVQNMETIIKSPFNTNPRVLAVMNDTHKKLQQAMVQLYPGNLVLSFDAGVMHHGLLRKITSINHVPEMPSLERHLGKYMCVPFGKILRGIVVPNTVTKTLHTEKMFDPEIKNFTITAFPGYSPLLNQLKTIKSFRRPILLIDDFLHNGYRLRELDPLFKEADVKIKKIVVGIMSGKGKDLMSIQKRQVDSIYFIPNMRSWFVESTLYPFIGGDMVKREDTQNENFLFSVNLILPYAYPTFIRDTMAKAIYHLSMTCLENTRAILQVLEQEYQSAFGRTLTLNRLSQVVIAPRCPDVGNCMAYDFNLPASTYVTNDIERLIRLKNLIE